MYHVLITHQNVQVDIKKRLLLRHLTRLFHSHTQKLINYLVEESLTVFRINPFSEFPGYVQAKSHKTISVTCSQVAKICLM